MEDETPASLRPCDLVTTGIVDARKAAAKVHHTTDARYVLFKSIEIGAPQRNLKYMATYYEVLSTVNYVWARWLRSFLCFDMEVPVLVSPPAHASLTE